MLCPFTCAAWLRSRTTPAAGREILGLLWEQVDLLERVVVLNPGETKKEEPRLIPLTDDLYHVLVMQKQTRD